MKFLDFMRLAGLAAAVVLFFERWPAPLVAACLLAGLILVDLQRKSAR